MVFVDGVNEIADRIIKFHKLLGHSRQILQMDVGGMPHTTYLKSNRVVRNEGSSISSQSN